MPRNQADYSLEELSPALHNGFHCRVTGYLGVHLNASYSDSLQTCLELTLFSANTQGLIDGGLAGLFWSYVWTFVGFGLINLSLAEMASMLVISSPPISPSAHAHPIGRRPLEDNTTGSLSLRRRGIKSS